MSTRRLLSLAVLSSLCVALLAVSQVSWAQEVTASIVGTITDQSGAAVAGATVKANSVERGLDYTAVTNNDGLYRISPVPAGTYKLKAWHERLPCQTKEIVVPESGELKVDFVLGIKGLPKS